MIDVKLRACGPQNFTRERFVGRGVQIIRPLDCGRRRRRWSTGVWWISATVN